MDRSTLDKELLVSLVEKYPNLYNKRRRDFTDKSKKEKAWTKIAALIGLPVIDIQKIWKDIRDRYVKERKKIALSPPDDPYEVNWYLFRKLKFLEEHVSSRSFSSRDSYAARVKEQSPTEEVLGVHKLGNFDHTEVEESLHLTMPSPASSGTVDNFLISNGGAFSEVGTQQPTSATMEHLIEDNLNVVSTIRNYMADKAADIAFGRYVGLQLQTIDRTKRKAVKRKIMDILEMADE